jgi:GTP-binding protein HflX
MLSSLERIYRRKVPPNKLITPELAKTLTQFSSETGKQIGIIINRDGSITHVIAGDAKGIFIPALDNHPLGRKPLRELRLIHTHLKDEALSNEDISDLELLRFDMIAALSIKEGQPYNIYSAYLMPHGTAKKYDLISSNFYKFDLNFQEFINSLESEMERSEIFDRKDKRERAILISASSRPKFELEESIEELKELAISNDVIVLDTVIQRLKEHNPKYLLGEGKLKELIIHAIDKGATLLIFDQNLTPSQANSIAQASELKVIDRTQLILDIFARRAYSRDGKVQVELAQLKYTLSRLVGKGLVMSRLMGGIGGRGPGEMKLEIDRRRIKDRIAHLEKELLTLSRARKQRRHKRIENRIPIVSIIGYTNAGKSTLLNNLTRSETFVEDKFFATLDTASRRLRFPKERNLIITDTVGFIRDLPEDLLSAFKATLEELEDADLLIHLVDISNPRYEQHILSVENILRELNLINKPRLIVFNKIDKLGTNGIEFVLTRFDAIAISAINKRTFTPLLKAIEQRIWDSEAHKIHDYQEN